MGGPPAIMCFMAQAIQSALGSFAFPLSPLRDMYSATITTITTSTTQPITTPAMEALEPEEDADDELDIGEGVGLPGA